MEDMSYWKEVWERNEKEKEMQLINSIVKTKKDCYLFQKAV